jgi:hypothetical protein
MSFFEIFGIIFLGILSLNAAIGIWAVKTAKSSETFNLTNVESNLHGLKVSKV